MTPEIVAFKVVRKKRAKSTNEKTIAVGEITGFTHSDIKICARSPMSVRSEANTLRIHIEPDLMSECANPIISKTAITFFLIETNQSEKSDCRWGNMMSECANPIISQTPIVFFFD